MAKSRPMACETFSDTQPRERFQSFHVNQASAAAVATKSAATRPSTQCKRGRRCGGVESEAVISGHCGPSGALGRQGSVKGGGFGAPGFN